MLLSKYIILLVIYGSFQRAVGRIPFQRQICKDTEAGETILGAFSTSLSVCFDIDGDGSLDKDELRLQI